MTEIQNSKHIVMTARHWIGDRNALIIGAWNFDIIWSLVFAIWVFRAISIKAICFYLNLLDLTMMIP